MFSFSNNYLIDRTRADARRNLFVLWISGKHIYDIYGPMGSHDGMLG
jgi:hypothetical protein